MAEPKPFHHGNLRAVLLDQAQAVLRKGGLDALSLRELAREAGVSHAAPRKHFADRDALLDALAERGFDQLAERIADAAAREPDDFRRALHAVASAYLEFAVAEPALLDLMFAAKVHNPSDAVRNAVANHMAALLRIIARGVDAGAYVPSDVERLTLVLSASVQGIGGLVTSGRITEPQSEALIGDAIALILAGASTDGWRAFADEHPWHFWTHQETR
ncbi:MAG: TetR/AcrR family transcriptional regulator [Actinomycetota bacterium]|uniref:TetR/AcrR family transcriptional regulator n=1 Tax=Mycobacterium lentiflavum TaxID=141349 RepID=A0ABY3UVX2_MYCLN|nr:TetR/AcrR family transcriptional regulator [Mycobacterium lentiflavum]MEE3065537.1 TetR/AcrR family transcriptional regulator [Actinomycetota bacterium]ULP42571.1 TetR/AcrR family transcriptional regulator [Mycobacterium lentiflavum]